MPRKRPNYLHSGKRSEDSENIQVSGLKVRCQRRSRERCKQQSKDCLVKVEGNYWGDVRQKHTNNKVESVQDGYETVWSRNCMEQNVGQLEGRRRKLHTTEMRVLRWATGKTRLDHVRNIDIWKEAHMYPMAEFLREKRLIWYGHVQRRDKDDATRKILQMTFSRWKAKLRQTKAEMARPGQRGYG